MRFTIIISLLAAAALSLAACGSSSPGGTATNASSKTLEFASCMRSHGVSNFPDPTGGHLAPVNGVEANGPAFQSAIQACRSHMPNAGTPSSAQTAKAKSQALAMSRCMRSHGVPNFPDPRFRPGRTAESLSAWTSAALASIELASVPGGPEGLRLDYRHTEDSPGRLEKRSAAQLLGKSQRNSTAQGRLKPPKNALTITTRVGADRLTNAEHVVPLVTAGDRADARGDACELRVDGFRLALGML